MNSFYRYCCALFLLLRITVPATAQVTPELPLYTSSTFDAISIDLSKAVGAIDGAAGTTPTGGATYTIPIKCPPGTAGMVPSIAISYNSQGGYGLPGMGWNISGLSAISRSGKDQYHDAAVSGLTYTNSDAFVLDGTRLATISGTNGANGTTYRTEAESYAVVTSLGTAGTGPQWFKVVSKDGSTMEFGNTADSRIMTDDNAAVMSWRLNKITDANGNYITFSYINTDRDSRISQISYTGHDGTGGFATSAPYHSINFTYTAGRRGANKVYDKGYSIESKYLLSQIQVLGEGEIFKTYNFNYASDGIVAYLKYVEEYAGDNTKLNETRFKYGDPTTDFELQASDIPVNTVNDAQMGLYSGDFNGDGLTDIVKSHNFLGYGPSGFERVNSFFVYTRNNAASDNYTNAFSVPHVENGFFPDPRTYTNQGFVPADYNGDGRDDILLYKLGTDNKFKGTTIYYANAGSPLSFTTTDYPPIAGANYYKSDNLFYTGDFDGDKKTDYLYTTFEIIPFPAAARYFSFVNMPGRGESNKQVVDPATGIADNYFAERFGSSEKMLIIDYDGDGRSEIMLQHDAYFYVYGLDRLSSGNYAVRPIDSGAYPSTKYQEVLGTGDFNGDGKTDFLTREKTAPYAKKIGYGTGKGYAQVDFTFARGYEEPCRWDEGSGAFTANGDDIYVGDYNGDGQSDIFQVKKSCNHDYDEKMFFDIYYSTGKDFKYETLEYTGAVGEVYPPVLGDVNGDGKVDFSFVRKGTMPSIMRTLYFKKNSKERLLEKVKDGMNRVTEFVQATLTQGSGTFYTKGSGDVYPLNNLQTAMYVVTATKAPDGIGGITEVSYAYENLRFHRGGRGLLGFGKITASNNTQDSRSESFYDLNSTYYLPYLKQSKSFLISSGAQLSNNETTSSYTTVGGCTYCYEQKVSDVLSQDLLAGYTTTTHSDYDTYGNVTQMVQDVQSGLELSTTNTSYIAASGSTIPSLPAYVTATQQRSGQPAVSKTTAFTYTGRKPSRITEFSGTTGAMDKVLTYDRYGNVLSQQTQQALVSSSLWPKTEYTYDGKGRFPIAQKNPLGQFSYTSYHKFWGQPISETSVSSITTTYDYDVWGKIVRVNMPGPYTVSYSEGWDISGNKRYYTLSQHPGAPDTRTWYDILGRPLQVDKESYGGVWASTVSTYTARGSLATATNSYLPTETPELTTHTYDTYNRLLSSTGVTGTTSYTYSYSGGNSILQVTIPSGQSTSRATDAAGRTMYSTDNGGTMSFTYDSRGNQLTARHNARSGVMVLNKYDDYGRKTAMTDVDAGTTTYVYNNLNQLKEQTDGYGHKYAFIYDILGRVTERIPTGYASTTYTYFGAAKNNQLQRVQIGAVISSYDYDALGRVTLEQQQAPGKTMSRSYGYNIYGSNTSTVYSSGLNLQRDYDANGYLQTVRTTNPGSPAVTLFDATSMNGRNQYTAYSKCNGLVSSNTYQYGLPLRYSTPGVQDLQMSYDISNGNLLSRRDNSAGYEELFTYDNLERLTAAQVNRTMSPPMSYPAQTINYDAVGGVPTRSLGNITEKSDAGLYDYSSVSRVHAVRKINAPAAVISHQTQDITYTIFNKTSLITENGYEQSYGYNGDDERYVSQLKHAGSVERQRWYFGDYEIDQVLPGGTERHIHYISGGDGLCAIVVKEAGGFKTFAAYTDHLGSLVKLTDEFATTVATQNFDAWGRERNPATWDYTASLTSTKPEWLYRGYTGHEMLPEFALINMNGRMYDPVNARMLRPDNYIQDPLYTQSYNRYSYCWNNPLKYTDPSGDIVWIMPSIGLSAKGVSIGITAGIGIPGKLSAQVSVSHNFGSGDSYVGVGGSLALMTASIGWGTRSGITANFGIGYPGFSEGGLSSNIASAGMGWNERSGIYAYGAGATLSNRGLSFDPGVGYSYSFKYLRHPYTDYGDFEQEDDHLLLKPITIRVFSDQMGQVMNAGGFMWGMSEMGIKRMRQVNAAKNIGKTLGFSTQQTAKALGGTLGIVSKSGKVLGAVGYGLSVATIGYKYATGQTVTTAENVGLTVSTVLIGAAWLAAGSIFAPAVAAGALIYSAAELGSYIYNGKTLEENIIE